MKAHSFVLNSDHATVSLPIPTPRVSANVGRHTTTQQHCATLMHTATRHTPYISKQRYCQPTHAARGHSHHMISYTLYQTHYTPRQTYCQPTTCSHKTYTPYALRHGPRLCQPTDAATRYIHCQKNIINTLYIHQLCPETNSVPTYCIEPRAIHIMSRDTF